MTRSFPLALLALLTACGGFEPTAEIPAPVTPIVVAPVQIERAAPVPEELPTSDVVAEIVEPSVSPVEPEVAPPTTYALRRGETLAHFARWAEMPVETVADTSGLDLDGVYPVGTEIALQLTDDERSIVEARRDAHHQLRARNYLNSRGSTRTAFYRVKSGDSAWTIASGELGMPVWMLESLNPSTDLERLRPGQELLVPVFEDIVVQVDEAEAAPSDRLPSEEAPDAAE
ncbi:MAG: LysM peptidoglycan-binding domain-containing protein [Myxococcales bacterium]|nr:LysM peptidoglycan-binding domain-containing protein [Myxococcales bacterium]